MIENEFVKLCKGVCIITIIGLLWAMLLFGIEDLEHRLERRRERRKEEKQ